MSCDWEGNRRSRVALAMCYTLKWFTHLQAQRLNKGNDHPTNTTHGYGTLYLPWDNVKASWSAWGCETIINVLCCIVSWVKWHCNPCSHSVLARHLALHPGISSVMPLWTTVCVGYGRCGYSAVGGRTCHVSGSRMWNELPQDVATAPSLPVVWHWLKT